MGPQHLIDINVVIDFFNGSLPAKGRNLLLSIDQAISVITHIELFSFAQMSATERAQLQHFDSLATVCDLIPPGIVQQTIVLRIQRKIKVPDAIIAATAIAHSLELITRNTSNFTGFNGLNVIGPYSL